VKIDHLVGPKPVDLVHTTDEQEGPVRSAQICRDEHVAAEALDVHVPLESSAF
jgi:hypothetical protein